MDINKEVDRLEKAVKNNDANAAIKSDSRLAVFEKQIMDGLTSMPKEHAETMSFYFRDWIMRTFDEVLYIFLIILGFNLDNDLGSFVLISLGAVLLVGTFIGHLSYLKFCARDMTRMRKEKMMAENYKLQLNYIRQSRAEHSKYIDQVIQQQMQDFSMTNLFSNILNEIKEKPENVNETQENSENSSKH